MAEHATGRDRYLHRDPARVEARPASGGRSRRSYRLAGMALAAALVVAPAVFTASSAQASVLTLVVNSAAMGGADIARGNGVCETVAGGGVCTLRAAVEESNALNKAAGEVEITVDPSIPVGTRMTGAPGDALMMDTSAGASEYDNKGKYLVVTAPVTINLAHRLLADYSAKDEDSVAFLLDGSGINLYNADQVLSGGTSIVFGPKARNVVVDGMRDGTRAVVSTEKNHHPERFLLFREGATDVTVKGYSVSGFFDDIASGGIFVFNSYQDVPTPMSNIVIDDVDVPYATASTTCSGTNGAGCRTRLVNMWGKTTSDWSTVVINGLTFKNLDVQNMTGQLGMTLTPDGTDRVGSASPTITNLVVEDNRFMNIQGPGTGYTHAFLQLPAGGKLQGVSSIRRNVFQSSGSGNNVAIYAHGVNAIASNNTIPSGLTIADNYFNNYKLIGIAASEMGLVTMTGNTFGSGSSGQAAAVEEYFDLTPKGMIDNRQTTYAAYSTNQSIRTWYPAATPTVLGGAAPAGAVTLTANPALAAMPTCPAVVNVKKPETTDNDTTTQRPGEPVTLEAYWTVSANAEVYLGKVTGVTGTTATLVAPLPVGPVTLPDGTVTPVDALTGVVSGSLRLQTHVEGLGQLESSQFSRTASFTGQTCRPAVSIYQATGQIDSTVARDLHFTISSTLALNPDTVTVDDVVATAEKTAETIDETRLNPRVVSVTPVDGSGGLLFDVIVRVDDSAKVTVTLGAETVATPSGMTNKSAATYGANNDHQITFVNPLQVIPPQFTLVTGEPDGKSYVLSIISTAPMPQSALYFTATVEQPPGTPAVLLSTQAPVIMNGLMQSDPITVTAAAGDVQANTQTTVLHTVTSGDANYDGLVVASVHPYLFSTDPTIKIEKTAYVARKDGTTFNTSSAAQIKATGVQAPKGSRLTDRQMVCFVYTVTNTSGDDWDTKLTDIAVTDTDERLGDGGLIDTISELEIGAWAEVFACEAILPVDTTTSQDAPVED